MNKRILLSLFLSLTLFVTNVHAADLANKNQKIRLGVMKFLGRAEGVPDEQAAVVGDVFARMLTSSKTITVIERDQLDAIASEHKLALSGSVTDETAVQIGKIAGCQYMLLGAVTNLAQKQSATDLWMFSTSKNTAIATIDVRVVNVETSEVKLSLSESGMSSQKGTIFNFYGMTNTKLNLKGMEAGAIADAASRLSFKVREALTGEYAQVIETGSKEITLGIGATGGAQIGKFFRVYVDGTEIFDSNGNSLGHKMNDIAVVKIVDVQQDLSIAGAVDKTTGNISLIRKGDKIYPITPEEIQNLVKRKAFPKSRARQTNTNPELEEFLKDVRD